MSAPDWDALLDCGAYPADRYARLADRLAALLGTRNDVVFVQAEAAVALEAAAASLASPGLRALNIVTSVYGGWFGAWLRRGGAPVVDLAAAPGRPIGAEEVARAMQARRFDLVAIVHAESASGILNPLEDVAGLARSQGALLVVDAVASAGGHRLEVDRLGIDVAVIGPQKALGGPAGISALAVSPRAWEAIGRNAPATRSVLSLNDIRRDWLEAGRGALPGMPSAMEFFLLEAALDRLEAEGLDRSVARHAAAARAAHAGLRALGIRPWAEPQAASNLVTTFEAPPGSTVAGLLDRIPDRDAGIGPAPPPFDGRLLRLDHTGRRAGLASIERALAALAGALPEASAALPGALQAARGAFAT